MTHSLNQLKYKCYEWKRIKSDYINISYFSGSIAVDVFDTAVLLQSNLDIRSY